MTMTNSSSSSSSSSRHHQHSYSHHNHHHQKIEHHRIHHIILQSMRDRSRSLSSVWLGAKKGRGTNAPVYCVYYMLIATLHCLFICLRLFMMRNKCPWYSHRFWCRRIECWPDIVRSTVCVCCARQITAHLDGMTMFSTYNRRCT